MSKENSGKKCIAIHLPIELVDKINDYKAKTGKSQSGLLTDLIEKGLGLSQSTSVDTKLYFFVKVRIDVTKMLEFGQKLQNGEIDTSLIVMTYCDKDDPAVGMSFWQASDRKSFEDVFNQFRNYYKEVIEIKQVVTPTESMKLIMASLHSQ